MATTIAALAINERAISYVVLGRYASDIVNHNCLRYIDKAFRPYGGIADAN